MPVGRRPTAATTGATGPDTRRAIRTASHGFRPSFRPLPDSATQLPMVNPATPTSRYWASDTMPTELDRNTIDDAPTPRINVWVRAKLTKKSVPISGITTSSATTVTTTPVRIAVRDEVAVTRAARTDRRAERPARWRAVRR